MRLFCRRYLNLQIVVMFLILCLGSQKAAAETDSPKLVGTWKLNVAKSQISGPPPRSLMIGFEWDAKTQTMSHTAERVTDKGERIVGGRWAAKYDGKDYPWSTGGSQYTHVRLKRTDAYTSDVSLRKDGKDVMTFHQVVSPDGKTLTLTRKRVGQDGADTEIYDRQ